MLTTIASFLVLHVAEDGSLDWLCVRLYSEAEQICDQSDACVIVLHDGLESKHQESLKLLHSTVFHFSLYSVPFVPLHLFIMSFCLPLALSFLSSSSPCLYCLFALFNHQTNVLWHIFIAHRHHFCQQPQKATFSLALLSLPACSHTDSPRKHCICHRLWLMALLIAVLGYHHTYMFCF